MLDPEFKAKWTAALRSGKYKQGTYALYTGEGYCCLGVACIVAGATFEERPGVVMEDGQRTRKVYYPIIKDGSPLQGNIGAMGGTMLSPDFRTKIGLGIVEQQELTLMNDVFRKTFAEIADHIDAKL